MRTIELKSGNPSYRYGGVLLTQKKPRATVSDKVAEAMLALGKVSEVTEATAGNISAVAAASDTGDAVSPTVSTAAAEEDATADETLKKVLAEIEAAKTKDALVTLAKKYGVDVSACKSNEARKAAILAAFE